MDSVDAHCFSCGYDKLLMVGGLMTNFKVYSAEPVSCENCKEMTTANYKATPLTCEVCNSSNVLRIDDPSTWLGDVDGSEGLPLLPLMLGNSDTPHLRGHYKCPKCGKFELRFGTNHADHPIISAD